MQKFMFQDVEQGFESVRVKHIPGISPPYAYMRVLPLR